MADVIRTATFEELTADLRTYLDHGMRVRYRHFVRETYNPRAHNGVSHREHGRAKPYVRDGKVYVMHHGEEHEITGTVCIRDGHKPFVVDIRLASEYLKPRFADVSVTTFEHDQPVVITTGALRGRTGFARQSATPGYYDVVGYDEYPVGLCYADDLEAVPHPELDHDAHVRAVAKYKVRQ